jgi:multiple sugar transport system permease protein
MRKPRPSTIAIILLAAVMLAPFFYMVSVSFMGELELLRWPPPVLPHAPTTANYAAALAMLPYGRVLMNTALLAGCVMVGQVLTSAAAGYVFARMRFPGRDGAFVIVLTTLAVPAILLVIPRLFLMARLGWVDTYPGLIATELVSVVGIVLMRQTFRTVPREVEEAARLDGAGEWTLFWRVMLPLARPAVVTLAVLAFLDQWRSLLWPLVITRTARIEVAEVALAHFHATYLANWPYQMAAAALVTLPVLLVGLLGHRYILQGLQFTGAELRS